MLMQCKLKYSNFIEFLSQNWCCKLVKLVDIFIQKRYENLRVGVILQISVTCFLRRKDEGTNFKFYSLSTLQRNPHCVSLGKNGSRDYYLVNAILLVDRA